MHHFVGMGGVIFQSLIVARTRWSNLEVAHVWICIMSSCTCQWPSWPNFYNCSYWNMLYVVHAIHKGYHYVNSWLMKVFERSAYWRDVLHHFWQKYILENGFVFNALKKSRYLFLNDMD
jgi:hypothetical protein